VLPVALVIGLSFIFGGSGRSQFTIGVLQDSPVIDQAVNPFLETRYTSFVAIRDVDAGIRKVARHQLDLLVDFDAPARYWVNPDSPKGYFAERVLLHSGGAGNFDRQPIQGEAIRYVDWVLPGILGMNMMFSCLFGVGYVVVRYRKNGFLKRLHATPLRAIEFVIAQVASRLVLIMVITAFVYAGTHLLLHTRMEGSNLTLLLIAFVGAIALVSMGLLFAARVASEELAGGMLNLATWPMMMLSGVWFSLEAAPAWVQKLALVFPLTHILDAARAVMLDGATLVDVADSLLILAAMGAVFLGLGAAMFRWRAL